MHNTDNSILSDDEVANLTGYKQAAKQAHVLRDNGIAFVVRPADGKIRTTWYNVNHPSHVRNLIAQQEQPDFSSLQKVS